MPLDECRNTLSGEGAFTGPRPASRSGGGVTLNGSVIPNGICQTDEMSEDVIGRGIGCYAGLSNSLEKAQVWVKKIADSVTRRGS